MPTPPDGSDNRPWHCDGDWTKELPICVTQFLVVARSNRSTDHGVTPPALFATYQDRRVQLTHANAVGDVDIMWTDGGTFVFDKATLRQLSNFTRMR